MFGDTLSVAPVREAPEQDLRVVLPALPPRRGFAQSPRHGARQLFDRVDLVAHVAPAPDDVVREPGGIGRVKRIGEQDDRSVERQELEDHAGRVRQEHVAGQHVGNDVGVCVAHEVHAAVGSGEPPPSAPSSAGASPR